MTTNQEHENKKVVLFRFYMDTRPIQLIKKDVPIKKAQEYLKRPDTRKTDNNGKLVYYDGYVSQEWFDDTQRPWNINKKKIQGDEKQNE